MEHHHVSAAAIRAQVAYSQSHASLFTARAMVSAKLLNCSYLLGSYRQARVRAASDQVRVIDRARGRLARSLQMAATAPNKQSLFLIEAQAAHSYWNVFALLCHAPTGWRRRYPHAYDGLNILLNTGYTTLTRRGMTALEEAGLLPEVGVLHGDNAGDGLVFDFIEPFRQPAVDAVLLPLFSRRRQGWQIIDEHTMKKGFARLHACWQKRFSYYGRCETIERILVREAISLRNAILQNKPWLPYQFRWGHSGPC